jgi:hypothetical protein
VFAMYSKIEGKEGEYLKEVNDLFENNGIDDFIIDHDDYVEKSVKNQKPIRGFYFCTNNREINIQLEEINTLRMDVFKGMCAVKCLKEVENVLPF